MREQLLDGINTLLLVHPSNELRLLGPDRIHEELGNPPAETLRGGLGIPIGKVDADAIDFGESLRGHRGGEMAEDGAFDCDRNER